MTTLDITTATSGFYEGFSKFVTIGSKVSIGALIVWAVAFPEGAGEVLKGIRATIDANTGSWSMYVMTFELGVC
jgi:choline-glycine betaine transporter